MAIKKFITVFCFLILLVVARGGVANTIAELKRSCESNSPIYAVPACEQLIELGQADREIYFKLAKLYQEQNELELAKVILEKALTVFSEVGDNRSANKTAVIKSEVDEQIWLQSQNRELDKGAELKLTCTNFSKVLPDKAIVACDDYLALFPGDSVVLEYRAIAMHRAGIASTRSTAEQEPVIHDTTIQNDVVNSGEVLLADMRKELDELYALLEMKNQSLANSQENKVVYFEQGIRRALVIGNANYARSIGKLKNPVNDAKDMKSILNNLGFEVTLLTDSTLEEMEKAVFKMAETMGSSDTFLFYYAGHGVALNGENYLIPVKSSITEAVDVKYKALNLSFLMDKLDRESTGATIIVLDACRNNPFPASRSTAQSGLVQTSGPSGTFIAYSTAPQQVAIDGTGRNGIYTKHLLQNISRVNISIEEMFKQVRVEVERETNGIQVPWENSSLKSKFFFNHGSI